jgi:hypothetical protein
MLTPFFPVRALDGGLDPLAPEPAPFETAVSTEPVKKAPSEFAKKAAERLGVLATSLGKLEQAGFGRGEMIRFTLIAKKSEKAWDDLVKERRKGAPFRKMAQDAKLDYNELFLQAERLRDEIDDELQSTKYDVQNGTSTKGRTNE